MLRGIRRFISVGALFCALATVSGASSMQPGAKAASSNLHSSKQQVAGYIIEVRIRRLHLVRPDLIPYPIAYEIIC
jgi:hypothetical protein